MSRPQPLKRHPIMRAILTALDRDYRAVCVRAVALMQTPAIREWSPAQAADLRRDFDRASRAYIEFSKECARTYRPGDKEDRFLLKYTFFSRSVTILQTKVEILERVARSGVLGQVKLALGLIGWGFIGKLGALQTRAQELEKRAKKARRQYYEVWVQMGLDVAVTLGTIYTPVGAARSFARAVGTFTFGELADCALGTGHSGKASAATNFTRSATDVYEDLKKAETAADATASARDAAMRKYARWVKRVGWVASGGFHLAEMREAYREYAEITGELKAVQRELAKTHQDFKKFFIDSKGGTAMKMLEKAKSQQILSGKKIAEDRKYYRKLKKAFEDLKAAAAP